MHPYPHVYVVGAAAAATGSVSLTSPGLAPLDSAPPAQFDGPGDLWSPESLLCAAVADCFVLTFRGIARASNFAWLHLECRTEAVLDRVEGVSRFTRCTTFATLTLAAGADAARARTLLEKAERGCLVANSLLAERHLQVELVAAGV